VLTRARNPTVEVDLYTEKGKSTPYSPVAARTPIINPITIMDQH
jgi:hypothetical protein